MGVPGIENALRSCALLALSALCILTRRNETLLK